MPIERKYERDVDCLLAEEFVTNPVFAEAVKGLTKFAAIPAKVMDFWVSKGNNLGESDLIVVYLSDENERFALLIEDKVDAPLQPGQAARYRLRAEQECAQGDYSDYEVILCAPRYYIENHSDLAEFDHRVSFEQLAGILRSQPGPRADYRAAFLETAASKHINTWSRDDDAATNDFWDAAYELATSEFNLLELKRLKLTKGSNWITARPRDFPTRPVHTHISLKGKSGFIDLTFGNIAAYLFKPQIAHLLHSDMSVHQAGASTAIRIETAGFLVKEGLVVGLPKVKAAFEAASRLITLYRTERAEFDQAANAAIQTKGYGPNQKSLRRLLRRDVTDPQPDTLDRRPS